ncbi:MAG TPA: hypothetical protein VHS74_16055 [Solirubrobacterales bacterium]|jgi:hypothetical protein|nr:hypothetical protein [Solirubrobacterales bacterium]
MNVGEASSISASIMQAAVPADVRSEGAGAVKGYRAALQFESMLLKEMLTEALPESPGGAGLGGEGEGEEGSAMTADPTTTTLPETVAESVVGAGGLGLAKQMYTSFEGGTAIKGGTQ